MLFWRASENLGSCQCKVDKGKLTAVANLEKLMFQASALHWSKVRIMGCVCVYMYWDMKICYWWNHSNGGYLNKLVE